MTEATIRLADCYDGLLMDLDGVVYIGNDAVPGAAEALDTAQACGLPACFVTNNASRPPGAVAAHLQTLGIAATPSTVSTSAGAAAAIAQGLVAAGASVHAVGGEGVAEALRAVGLIPLRTPQQHPGANEPPRPSAVVIGFGADVGWRDLAWASYWVSGGAHFIATNLDRTFPQPWGAAPGNGVFVSAVHEATGVRPIVAGKPEPTLFHWAAQQRQWRRPLVVGDRLDTDIAGAVNSGYDSLVVLTGVTDIHDLLRADARMRPTMIASDLAVLAGSLLPIAAVGVSDDRWQASGWSATMTRATNGWRVDLEHAGPAGHQAPLQGHQGLAATLACAAVWSRFPDGVPDGSVEIHGWPD